MGIDATIVGSAGVALLLLAFFLNLLRYLRADGALYLVLNLVGSVILAVLAAVEHQLGFLLLEGVWSLVSLWSLIQVLLLT